MATRTTGARRTGKRHVPRRATAPRSPVARRTGRRSGPGDGATRGRAPARPAGLLPAGTGVSGGGDGTKRRAGAGPAKLTGPEISARLHALDRNWRLADGAITRRFEFRDFKSAMRFVNAMAKLAEQANHHPDFDVRYSKVDVALTTHDAGGLADPDFVLAAKLDRIATT